MADIAPRDLQDVYLLKCDLNVQCGHCNLAMYSIYILIFLKTLELSFTCSTGIVAKMQFSLNLI